MYSIEDFVPYTGEEDFFEKGDTKVLAWSKENGYYFTEFGFCLEHHIKIIGVMK